MKNSSVCLFIIALTVVSFFSVTGNAKTRCVYQSAQKELSVVKPEYTKGYAWSKMKEFIYMEGLLPYYEMRRLTDSFDAANRAIGRFIRKRMKRFPQGKMFPILLKAVEHCIKKEGKI